MKVWTPTRGVGAAAQRAYIQAVARRYTGPAANPAKSFVAPVTGASLGAVALAFLTARADTFAGPHAAIERAALSRCILCDITFVPAFTSAFGAEEDCMKRTLLTLMVVASAMACNTNKGGDASEPGIDTGGVTPGQNPGGNGNGNDANNVGVTPGNNNGVTNPVPGVVTPGGGTTPVGPLNSTNFGSGPSLSPNSPYVHYIGRIEQGALGGVRLAWPGSGITVRVTGASSITASLLPNQYVENNVVGVLIDGKDTGKFVLADGKSSYPITVPAGDHLVTIFKRTEAGNGEVLLSNLTTNGQFEQLAPANGRLIEVIGENAAAGYSSEAAPGVTACAQPVNSVADPATQNALNTFGALTAQSFAADWSILAWSGRGLMQNYDGSRGSNVAAIYPRLNPQNAASNIGSRIGAGAVIINVGTNDINYWLQNTRGVQADPAGFQAAYLALIKQARALNPNAAILVTTGATLSGYQCLGGAAAGPCNPSNPNNVLGVQTKAIQGAIAAMNDSKVTFLAVPTLEGQDIAACYMPSASGHAKLAAALIPAVASATGWTANTQAAAQPAAAAAGNGPKTLGGTFPKRPDPINDPNSALMKVTIEQYPQCHYCSPQLYNANNVGTAACPALIGESQPCQGYCHEPDGFAPPFHSIPPTSGNHYSDPKPQGFYTTAVPRGRLVHSMEHGAVVLTYNCPDGCAAEVASMQALYSKYPGVGTTAWLVVSPDPLLTGAKFAAASWTWKATFDTFDAAAMECFILQHTFYGRECLAASTNPADRTGYPRNCPPILDQYMSSAGG